MTVKALPLCLGCGTKLPIHPGRGRQRKWCSEACRSRKKRERSGLIAWESLAGEFADASVVDPLTRRREMVEAVTALLEGDAAAPAIDRAAQLLLELRNIIWIMRRLETELPPRIAGRFGEVGKAIEGALARSFGEVVNL